MTLADTHARRPLREACWHIGGLGVRVRSADPGLTLTGPLTLRPFRGPSERVDAVVGARWGRIATEPAGSLLFDSGGLWTLTRDADDLSFVFRSPKFGPVPYKTARFRSDFSHGEVILHRPYFDQALPVYPLEYPLDELLFVNLLAHRDGVELHGCGVSDCGAGLLFVGPSGAGKSTIARLWRTQPGVTVLSDDRIIVRREGDQFIMHGTPWHGDEPVVSPGPVKLKRLFVLRQDARCDIRELDGAAAAAALFACCFPPFYSREAIAATLGTLEFLVRAAPCAELWFRQDEAVIRYVRSLL